MCLSEAASFRQQQNNNNKLGNFSLVNATKQSKHEGMITDRTD